MDFGQTKKKGRQIVVFYLFQADFRQDIQIQLLQVFVDFCVNEAIKLDNLLEYHLIIKENQQMTKKNQQLKNFIDNFCRDGINCGKIHTLSVITMNMRTLWKDTEFQSQIYGRINLWFFFC